jgi:hypothetical protein
MIQAYHDHSAHHDKFAMLAIHDSSVDSFSQLDGHLERIKKQYWKGEDLPFPVLLDKDRKTETVFGVSSHPTQILIDPEGNIVGEAGLASLEKELPSLGAEILWARQLDMQKNVYWSWDKALTVKSTLKFLKAQSGMEIELDAKTAEKLGLSLESTLPGFIDGYGITLRSIEQMMLRPNGLAVEPSEDNESLILTKNTRSEEPLSHFQELHRDELEKRIATIDAGLGKVETSNEFDWKGVLSGAAASFGALFGNQQWTSMLEERKITVLEFDDLELQKAVKRIASHFELPMGIDRNAMERAQTKVSGKIKNEALKRTLNKMLEPIGLRVIVKFEMVLITKME